MGLFSKHKEDKKQETQKVPSVPSANSSESSKQAQNSSQTGMDVPPVPKPGSYMKPEESPTLSGPPSPPGVDSSSLDDIKSQVTNNKSINQNSSLQETSDDKSKSIQTDMPKLDTSNTSEQNQTQENNQQISFDSNDDDDLFDFSNLDVPSTSSNEENNLTNKSSPQSKDNESSSLFNPNEETQKETPRSDNDLNFINNHEKLTSNQVSDSFFVTTSQYKSLMEIIDRVKERVKESSDSHLRLLDIKSEEDTEYETLRKDFQFIEDKLYEIDSLIFDK